MKYSVKIVVWEKSYVWELGFWNSARQRNEEKKKIIFVYVSNVTEKINIEVVSVDLLRYRFKFLCNTSVFNYKLDFIKLILMLNW